VRLRPKKLETPITILTVCGCRETSIFKNEFLQLEDANPNMDFKVTCTRLEPNDPWQGRRGRIDAAWIKEHHLDLKNTVFYACGPTALVRAWSIRSCTIYGVPKEQVKNGEMGIEANSKRPMLKRTPLFERHHKLGGKLLNSAAGKLPVPIQGEHHR